LKRVARWHICQKTKKTFEYILESCKRWHSLHPFGIFCCHLVYSLVIWYTYFVAILHIAKKYLATLVRNNIYISPFRKQSHLELIGSGLPDFSLFNVPKRGKIFQMATNLPNWHKIYQMTVTYSNDHRIYQLFSFQGPQK
jgi:hypothetical protein